MANAKQTATRQSIYIYPKLWRRVLKLANKKGLRVWACVCELLEAGLTAGEAK